MNHTRRRDIRTGTAVSVVLKNDQGTGRRTQGIVQDILTNSSDHPQGIKVRLQDGQVGRVAQIHSTSSCTPSSEQNAYPDLYGAYDNDNDNGIGDHLASRHQPSLGDWFPDLDNRSKGRPEQLQREIEDQPWSCATCTFLNNGALRQCEICETSRAL